MTLSIVEVAPEAHRTAAIELVRRYLNPSYDGARFDWLYSRNPAGPGRLWVARDAQGALVGTAGAFPRHLSVNGEETLGWVLGDFCVAESHRTLGPALALQRACLEALGAQKETFCYDFPGPAMMPVYKRLRVGSSWWMRRFARVLRTGPKLHRYLRVPLLARGLGAVADLVLVHRARGDKPAGWSTSLQAGRCGEEFSALAAAASGAYGICLRRTALYVNWRFLDSPITRYEILTARIHGKLVGYAAFTRHGADATLADVFALPDAVEPLVRSAADLLRRRGCASLSVDVLESHPWTGVLARLGFSPRERSPFVLFPPSALALSPETAGAGALFFTAGDRDA